MMRHVLNSSHNKIASLEPVPTVRQEQPQWRKQLCGQMRAVVSKLSANVSDSASWPRSTDLDATFRLLGYRFWIGEPRIEVVVLMTKSAAVRFALYYCVGHAAGGPGQ
jgi:hypothetical protein